MITFGRVGLLIFFPLAIVVTVVLRILIELRRIPFYVWCDIREEWASFLEYWEYWKDAR